MGPLKIGGIYGAIAAFVTVVVSFRFLYLDPASVADWVLAIFESFAWILVVTAQLFLAILAAVQVRPVLREPGVPYRSLLLRDCTLAATVVAVLIGISLLLSVALQATVFAGTMRDYAREASPEITSYFNEQRQEIREEREERGESREEVNDLPPLASAESVEAGLQPPVLNDLGRSLFNLVMRALLLGGLGAVVGILRGRSVPADATSDGTLQKSGDS